MDRETQLQHAFRSAFTRPALLQPATVLSVDKEKQIATVVLTASQTEVEARLQALGEPATSYFLIIPKPESSVLVTQMGEEYVVLLTSEVDTLQLTAKTPLSVIVGEESLGKLLADLLSALKALKVPTPSGISGVPFADTQTQLGQIETTLSKILKTD